MKKLFVLLSILSFAFMAYGAGTAPTRVVVDSRYEVDVDSTWGYGTLDTLSGADTLKIADNYTPEMGYEYILANSSLSGDSASNAVVAIWVAAYDALDSLIAVDTVDTLDTVAVDGGYYTLPFGNTIVGHHYDIYLSSINANDEVKVQGLWLYRRRPLAIIRKWK